MPRHAERPRTPSNVDGTPSQRSADGTERRARRDMSQRPTRVVRSWCPRPGAQRSGAVTCGVRTYAEQVAAAAMSRHASSQRVARTVDPYNATADVCQRDKSVVIRARRAPTNAAPRHPTPWRRSGTPSRSPSPVSLSPARNPRPPPVRPAATPRKCFQHPAGMSGEASFSTRKPRVARPDRRHFRDQVSGKSPGISPPKFRPSSIGPAESDPHVSGVAPRRGSHPDAAVAEASACAKYRLGGTPRTSIRRASAL